MDDEVFVTSKICMVKDVGLNNTLFGGNMLAWVDEAAAIFAMKATHMPNLVTRHLKEIDFHLPVKVGTILDFEASNTHIGDTSISFCISVTDYYDHSKVYFATYITMVAVDENGNRTKILGKE